MEPILFPVEVFRPAGQEWSLQGASQEGGRPQVGSTPQRILFGGGGLNVAKFTEIRLRSRQQFSAWRAIALQMDNGGAQITVPYCNRRSGPVLTRSTPVPHSDGTYFDDGTGYLGSGVASFVTSAAAYRATSMTVRVLGGRPLIGGEPFSFRHTNAGWRIYWVAAVESTTQVTSGDAVIGYDHQIRFRSPLREKVSANDPIEWSQPRCWMRLTDVNGMSMKEEMLRFASVEASFIEDLTVFATDLGF